VIISCIKPFQEASMPDSQSQQKPVTAAPVVQGAHLVGSVSLPDSESVFRAAASRLGAHLKRIPDGETGERFHWLLFQGAAFEATPGLSRIPIDPIDVAGFDVRPFLVDEGTDPAALSFAPLGYAAAALDSWQVFSRLRSEGVISPDTRFQVSLPSPLATVTTFMVPEFRAAVEPAYEAALLRELRQITDVVPAADLAIQWDLAIEFALIERVRIRGVGRYEAWFDDVVAGCTARAVRIGEAVPEGVELGYHLCYGDVGEKHFVEPADAGHLTQVANGLFRGVRRSVDFLHLPVPIERDDGAYYQPLSELELPEGTELYLGLIHHEDGSEGARRRIAAAGKVLPRFGIATECGFGRGPAERIAPLLDLHAEVIGGRTGAG
jgi:hypothetical protein